MRAPGIKTDGGRQRKVGFPLLDVVDLAAGHLSEFSELLLRQALLCALLVNLFSKVGLYRHRIPPLEKLYRFFQKNPRIILPICKICDKKLHFNRIQPRIPRKYAL